MRGYGLPRIRDVEFPNVVDIQTYGRASHVGKFSGKSGDFHSSYSQFKKNVVLLVAFGKREIEMMERKRFLTK